MPIFFRLLTFWIALSLSDYAHANPQNTQEAITQLNQAVQLYQMSDRTEAMQRFLSISVSENYPDSVRQEARIYMAEILLLEGNSDGAETFIRQILQTNPRYNIDQFRHPPEICSFFKTIKEDIASTKPEPTQVTVTQNPPITLFLPFGVHQFSERRWGKALTCSIPQVLLVGGSLGMRRYLQLNQSPKAPLEDESKLNSILIGQYSVTTLFYLNWISCGVDAYRVWKKKQNLPQQ